LVSTDKGEATSYALQKVEEHGTMFIVPGDICYEGMIVGEHRYPVDLAVNCTMLKPMTNVRSSTREMMIVLKAPRKMSLEACLDYINLDELVEITPHAIRMRKTNPRHFRTQEVRRPQESGCRSRARRRNRCAQDRL
jgi:GTP-binding protein